MNSFVMFAVFALAAVASAEPPSGYNYRPANNGGGFSSGGGYSSGGGFSSGGSAFGGSSNYVQEQIGPNTNEGQNIDPQLLDKIRNILLQEESKAGSGSQGGFGGFGGQGPQSSYGPPKPQYGPPSVGGQRVVGIILENTIPSIQVAQYKAEEQGSSGGYSSGGYSSGPSFSAPSQSYGAPSAPSSSYGAPQRPSSNYGAPF